MNTVLLRYFVGLLLLMATTMLAPTQLFAQDFITGYPFQEGLLRGAIVSNSSDGSSNIQAAQTDNIPLLLGVVVNARDSPLALSEDTAGIFVATAGKYEVLVSDINGAIRAGDPVTASAISSIGMKADGRQELVVGTALQDLDFTQSENIISTVSVTEDGGQERTVGIGKILVEVSAEKNPAIKGVIEKTPDAILNFGETVAGKQISPVRIYAALAIFVISIGTSSAILYSSVKNSFSAIGRNPLAKASVTSGMRQVMIVVFLIFISGIFGVYLLLRI